MEPPYKKVNENKVMQVVESGYDAWLSIMQLFSYLLFRDRSGHYPKNRKFIGHKNETLWNLEGNWDSALGTP